MECPACNDGRLKPGWLEPNLPAYRCNLCQGVLLQLISYRAWNELGSQIEPTEDGELVSDDTAKALQCPRCDRLMVKFRFATETGHRLDICTRCEDVWLDDGEWDYLKHRCLHGELPEIFTEPWQRQLHKRIQAERTRDYWTRRLGDQAEDAESVRDWLMAQPNKRDILLYLMDRDVD